MAHLTYVSGSAVAAAIKVGPKVYCGGPKPFILLDKIVILPFKLVSQGRYVNYFILI